MEKDDKEKTTRCVRRIGRGSSRERKEEDDSGVCIIEIKKDGKKA